MKADPAPLRAPATTPATGWALSVGRLGAVVGPSLGGRILASGLDLKWSFYIFAAIGALAALAAVRVPPGGGRPRTRSHVPPAVLLRPDSAV
ncbi:hypothetical protein ACIPSJ_40310 [Streptomyces sp. NPDC090088]|uniref:hypothetical protein n=1 Tax=Streptomyces sp. NPDC090088 TaxID=3365944 RepID=UPI003824630E